MDELTLAGTLELEFEPDFALFFILEKSAKNPLTRLMQSFTNTSWNVQRRG